jgi:hypothetical protein
MDLRGWERFAEEIEKTTTGEKINSKSKQRTKSTCREFPNFSSSRAANSYTSTVTFGGCEEAFEFVVAVEGSEVMNVLLLVVVVVVAVAVVLVVVVDDDDAAFPSSRFQSEMTPF